VHASWDPQRYSENARYNLIDEKGEIVAQSPETEAFLLGIQYDLTESLDSSRTTLDLSDKALPIREIVNFLNKSRSIYRVRLWKNISNTDLFFLIKEMKFVNVLIGKFQINSHSDLIKLKDALTINNSLTDRLDIQFSNILYQDYDCYTIRDIPVLNRHYHCRKEWQSIAIAIAFVRANENHSFKNSFFPLVPYIKSLIPKPKKGDPEYAFSAFKSLFPSNLKGLIDNIKVKVIEEKGKPAELHMTNCAPEILLGFLEVRSFRFAPFIKIHFSSSPNSISENRIIIKDLVLFEVRVFERNPFALKFHREQIKMAINRPKVHLSMLESLLHDITPSFFSIVMFKSHVSIDQRNELKEMISELKKEGVPYLTYYYQFLDLGKLIYLNDNIEQVNSVKKIKEIFEKFIIGDHHIIDMEHRYYIYGQAGTYLGFENLCSNRNKFFTETDWRYQLSKMKNGCYRYTEATVGDDLPKIEKISRPGKLTLK
jgi:hypothetical protein